MVQGPVLGASSPNLGGSQTLGKVQPAGMRCATLASSPRAGICLCLEGPAWALSWTPEGGVVGRRAPLLWHPKKTPATRTVLQGTQRTERRLRKRPPAPQPVNTINLFAAPRQPLPFSSLCESLVLGAQMWAVGVGSVPKLCENQFFCHALCLWASPQAALCRPLDRL